MADILALAVGNAEYFQVSSASQHLPPSLTKTVSNQSIGLVSKEVDVTDEETNMNILLGLALERIAFLPFGYMISNSAGISTPG